MPQASFAAPVNAPIAELWALLLDKIEHPDKYVPGVSQVKILEKTETAVLREMTAGDLTLKEWITWDEKNLEVCFTLVEHPRFSGDVINKIIVSDRAAEPISLEFRLHWQPKQSQPDPPEPNMSQAIEQAVLHTKALAESRH